MKIYIEEDPLKGERVYIGSVSSHQDAFGHIERYFQNKLDKEREQMGIDLKVQEALKTLKEFLNETNKQI